MYRCLLLVPHTGYRDIAVIVRDLTDHTFVLASQPGRAAKAANPCRRTMRIRQKRISAATDADYLPGKKAMLQRGTNGLGLRESGTANSPMSAFQW